MKNEVDFIIVCWYVDDLIYFGSNHHLLANFKYSMMRNFEMANLGIMKYFPRIQVKQERGEIFISSRKICNWHLEEILHKGFWGCKYSYGFKWKLKSNDGAKFDENQYKSLVGSIIYLTQTRPDITQAVSMLSRFMHNPSVWFIIQQQNGY